MQFFLDYFRLEFLPQYSGELSDHLVISLKFNLQTTTASAISSAILLGFLQREMAINLKQS